MWIRDHRLCALAAACLVTCAATDARADPAAVAEALFRDGTQLLSAGQIDLACPKFAESQKIDAALGTLFYLALCHEKQGLSASAWSEFSAATEWAQRTNQPERVLLGRKHVAQLEAKLATVIIHATQEPGLELHVDDGLLSAAAVGTPLPLDPGPHVIEAVAPGFEAWRTTIAVPRGAAKLTVTVPPLANAAAPVEAAEAAPPVLESKPAVAPVHPGLRVLTWTAGSVAVASLAAGSIFGAVTFASRDHAISECPSNRCTPAGLSDIDRAKTYATISTVGFGVGLAAAVATTYLLLRGTSQSRAASTQSGRPPVSVAPNLSPHAAGLAVTARFE